MEMKSQKTDSKFKERHIQSSQNDAKQGGFEQQRGIFSITRLEIIIIGGIVAAEVIAMIAVYYVRHLPYYQQVILDAAIMVLIISPWLYQMSFKPLLVFTRQQAQTEKITQARLRLIQFAETHSLDELLQAVLDEVEALVGGQIGFFHFLGADQKTIELQAWSTNTLQNMCKVKGEGKHDNVDKAGVWTDCFWQRKPVIHNDYAALMSRKGSPEGHSPIIRELTVPIIRNDRVVAILGIGNKPQEFTATDMEIVSMIADSAWDIVEHKRAENALRISEAKFRNLADWTNDWELWVEPAGTFNYCSPACERITGWSAKDFITDPDLLHRIVHPNDLPTFQEHQKIVHDASAAPSRLEFQILRRDGQIRWIEHVCRPIVGENDKYLGRRVSNRDITERKRREQEIQERHQREKQLIQTIHTMQMDIARDLHDTVGQNISYLRMKLDYLTEKPPPTQTEMNTEIRNMFKAANESYDLMRGTLAVLNLESSADLLELFKHYAEQISVRSTFEIDFTNYGEPQTLSVHQMRQLFYIFREALSNIEKYADASQVSVEITWDEDHLVFVIFDNGQGFDATQPMQNGHYGLKSMQERAAQLNGSLQVYSSSGSGTNIVLYAPYEQKNFASTKQDLQFSDETKL